MKAQLFGIGILLIACICPGILLAIAPANDKNQVLNDQRNTSAPILKNTNAESVSKATNFSGDILVGTGQTYTSLTWNNPSGLFQAINSGIVTGNINILITSNIEETGAIPLYEFASPYTMTIKPNAAETRIVSGLNMNQRGLLRFSGADRVTIDGSYNNSGNYLTIYNYSSAGNLMSVQLQNEGTGAGCTDFTIRNCTIKTGSVGATSIAIHIGGMNMYDGGAGHSNITIENNIINRAYYGLFVKGISTNKATDISILDNQFGTEANSIAYNAIFVLDAINVLINDNTISNYTTNTNITQGQKGIYLINTTTGTLSRNRIHGMKTVLSGSKGIDISSCTSVLVHNNLIYDIGGPGSNTITDPSYPCNVGIAVFGSSSSISMYYNTVNLFGTFNKYMSTISASVFIASGSTGINLVDNILLNNILNTFNTGDIGYSAYDEGSNSVFTSVNFNEYYGNGTQYKVGYLSGNKTTLSEWQEATGGDAQSLSTNPLLVSDTCLQPVAGSPVIAAGIPITGITGDINNISRSLTNPTIGAYETAFQPPAVDWCNLQSPGMESKVEGLRLAVTARVEEAGITNSSGQGTNIEAWIGWNNSDTDPATWTNWTVATYTMDAGNRDEYQSEIGGDFTAGTYYIASRFRLNGSDFRYGGYNASGGGFWNGSTNVSGQFIVQDNAVEWANLDAPGNVTITQGDPFQAEALIKVPQVTTLNTESPGLYCEIGIGYDDSNPNTWDWWQWQSATFVSRDAEKHRYSSNIESMFPGTYYLASRFGLCDDPEVYGGYSSSGGDFWNGTTVVSGILTIEQLVVDVPYLQDFNAPSFYPLGWYYEDSNNDGYSWYNYNQEMEIDPNSEPMDDWLFSPGINMQAGFTYIIEFSYGTQSAAGTEKMELKYGSSSTSADMGTSPIFSDINITDGIRTGYAEITPSTSGVYFLGWHGFSDPNQGTLFIDDIVINVTDTWTGLVSQYWSVPGNWSSGNVPLSTTNVRINSPSQVIVDLPHAHCNKLVIKAGASLTINPSQGLEIHGVIDNSTGATGLIVKSNAIGTGSIITYTSGVNAKVERYLTGGTSSPLPWHFISSPVDGQLISTFVSGTANLATNGPKYGLAPYDNTIPNWAPYTTATIGSAGPFNSAKGYEALLTSDGTTSFSGILNASDISIAITNPTAPGTAWNLIGNPFPCVLYANLNAHATNNFLSQNSMIFDAGYEALYFWNSSSGSYNIINQATPAAYIPLGQAFFVKSRTDGALAYFTSSMRTIFPSPIFMKAGTSNPNISLRASINQFNRETEVYFIEGTTTGIDEGYDAGNNSTGNSGVSIFTQITGSDIEFGIQSLPSLLMKTTEIPIGVKAPKGSTIIFTAIVLNMPQNMKVYLEDRETGTFTRIDNQGSNYSLILNSESSGTGRFFLITTPYTYSIEENGESALKIIAVPAENKIRIIGTLPSKAVFELVELNGRLIKRIDLNGDSPHEINLSLIAGLYLARIYYGKTVINRKIIWTY